jgi:hypothetical protein
VAGVTNKPHKPTIVIIEGQAFFSDIGGFEWDSAMDPMKQETGQFTLLNRNDKT